MRPNRRTSPDQSALRTAYEMQHQCKSSAGFPATSPHHGPVSRGQSGYLPPAHRKAGRSRWFAKLIARLITRD